MHHPVYGFLHPIESHSSEIDQSLLIQNTKIVSLNVVDLLIEKNSLKNRVLLHRDDIEIEALHPIDIDNTMLSMSRNQFREKQNINTTRTLFV